ncbi:MAG: hypothetical protein IT209_00785 [Armatimonadetes bacterium]|nr:hypothetical protein [Armatimonadota bacterium]
MALFRWRGGYSADFNDGRNWVDANGSTYAAGTYPGSAGADDVVFDAAKGAGTNCNGYDGSGGTALTSFRIGSLWDGTIGSSGTPLKLTIATVEVDGAAMPVDGLHLYGANATGLTTVTVHRATNGINLYGNVKFLYLLGGSAVCENAWVSGHEVLVSSNANAISGGNLTIPSSGAAPSNGVTLIAGTLSSAKSLDLNISGGTATLGAGAGVVKLYAGVVNWTAGNITTLSAYGGTFNALAPTPQSITTIRMQRGATVNLDNGLGNVTYSNLYQDGGTLSLP